MQSIREQWEQLSIQEQITFLTCCVRKAANRELINPSEFIYRYDINALVNEAWVTLMERMTPEMLNIINVKRAQNGNGEISLTSLVYRSARSAILRTYRAECKNPSVSFEAVEHTPGTQDITASVVLSAAIESALTGRDIIDHMVVKLACKGATLSEIADAAGISVPAIHKRITKLRTIIRKCISI